MEESEERTAQTTNISSNTESSGRPAARMSLDATVNWELCLFCQQVSYKKIESYIMLQLTMYVQKSKLPPKDNRIKEF